MTTTRGAGSVAALVLSVVAGLAAAAQDKPETTKPPFALPKEVNPLNATWHIGLCSLFGAGKKQEGSDLNIYVVCQAGKWVNALATARNYNTSVHLIEANDVVFDPAAKMLTGTLRAVITPDLYVPTDGQPYVIAVELKGKAEDHNGPLHVEGTYTARRQDGKPLYADRKVVEANLQGGPEPTQTGFDDSVWRASMTQVSPPGGLDLDALEVTLGVSDGKVQWGLIGQTPQAKMPAARTYPFDVSGFGPVSDAGIAQGSTVVTGRHLHSGGDPAAQYRLDFVVRRVQGLSGGGLTITRLADGKPTDEVRHAYGRGSVSKGGGKTKPEELWVHDLDSRPWWTPIAGHKAVAAGEHPRLLFRRDDLAKLRQRAETPEGKAILARLRKLLGHDGEALPDVFNPVPPANGKASSALPLGAFTTWHAAGFGFLYQITGDKKYADLARGCAQFMLDGKVDIDNRYAWFKPGTDLRAGHVLAAMGYAYDFCYDAWPEDFRVKIALEIQDFNKETCSPKEPASILRLSGRSGYPPGSNHYGSLIGGTGVALLAIQGDAGTDGQFVAARLAEIESNIPRMLELGFGDAGWFAEGFGYSSALSRVPTMELIHALRCVSGKDYLQPRPNAEWMMLTWIMHLSGAGRACMPNRGGYEGDNGAAREGEFSIGFGALTEKYRPALLWSYRTFVARGEAEPTWDAGPHPHSAVYAFLTWPLGTEPKNPAEVLPLAAVDHVHGYFVARNRWQDADDVIVTHWLEYGPKGYYSSRDLRGEMRAGMVRIWGFGLRTALATGTAGGRVTHYAAAKDGSFTVTSGGAPTGLAVDFSKASGAEAVMIAVGPGALGEGNDAPAKNNKASTQVLRLKLGAVPVHVLTLQTAEPPKVAVDGNAVVVGAQRFTWDGKALKPQVFKD